MFTVGGGGEEARLHPDYVLLSNRLSGRGVGRGAGGRGEKEYCHKSKFPFFPGEYKQSQWNVGTVENNTSEWERYF